MRWSARLLSPVLTAVLTTQLIAPPPANAQGDQRIEIAPGISIAVAENWSRSDRHYRNALELVSPPVQSQEEKGIAAIMTITTELRRSHIEAVRRLAQIAAEVETPIDFVEIGGWPALQREYRAPLEIVGEKESEQVPVSLRVTTAIAADSVLVEFQTTLAPDADRGLADQARLIAHNTLIKAKAKPEHTAEELRDLRRHLVKRPPQSEVLPRGPSSKTRKVSESTKRQSLVGTAQSIQTGFGELEVSVSNDGQNLVVAANSGYSNSTNAGQTFTFRGGTPAPFPRDGDPSLAFGTSGAFYYGFIGFPNGTAAAGGVTGCSIGISRSTDNGATFPFVSHAVLCPQTGASICFPDQEHIAADSLNSAPMGDQVYSVWRNFLPVGTPPPTCNGITVGVPTAGIVCSSNNGSTWTAPALMPAGSDFPRITVGSDGFVYVVYRSGSSVMINKFGSCASGLVQQAGFPTTVSSFSTVVCPVAGLDRCNSGNVLSSPTVAVDDANPNHIYVAYATNTAAGNENVVITDSVDGGLTWPRNVTTNSGVTGRRFMPWTCSLGGTAYVSWYDRRAASATSPDLTDYFLGSAFVRTGGLQAGGEENLTGNPDPECATGFPCGAGSTSDFTACSTTGTASGGCPKYGDYNGNACAAGRVYTAWASATAPSGLPAVGSITVFASIASRMYFTDAKESNGSVYELVAGNASPIFTFSGALSGNQAYHSTFDLRTGKLYVSNSNKFNLYAVDSTTGSASVAFTHTTYLRDVAFDPSGNLYFSEATGASANGKIYRLNLATNSATLFYTVVLSSVGGFWAGDFTFAPDGHLYISNGNEVGAQIFRIDDPAMPSAPVSVYSLAGESITGITFDRAGRFYYSNWDSTDGHIYQLDLATGTRQLIYTSPGRWIWDVSFR